MGKPTTMTGAGAPAELATPSPPLGWDARAGEPCNLVARDRRAPAKTESDHNATGFEPLDRDSGRTRAVWPDAFDIH